MTLDGVTVTIVAASNQNVFFEEIEESVAHACSLMGAAVRRVVDYVPEPGEDEVFILVPHEFAALTEPAVHPDSRQLARIIALATEQPGEPWFELEKTFCSRAAATLDINRIGVRALRGTGIDAEYLPLCYCPTWDAWHGDFDRARPVDVLFLGNYTERRARALAVCGRVVSRYQCKLVLTDNTVPLRPDVPGVDIGESKWRQYADAKVLLNIHRSPRPYFEWHRCLSAMINGCVLVTEHSLDVSPLVAGDDYLSGSLRSLPHLLDLVLHDGELHARLQQSALARIRTELPAERMAGILARAIERVLARRLPRGKRGARVPSVPRSRPPAAPTPPWMLQHEVSEAQVMRSALKLLIQSHAQLARQLRRLEHRNAAIVGAESTFGPYQDARPEVSVVLTLYNYAPFVPEAIASVARCDHPAVELVIVDDASTDDSVAVVRRELDRYPWLPVLLIELPDNRGLPRGRNLGLERSRGEFVYILDADNAMYPRALSALAGALRDDPKAAFAYAILEEFDARGPSGLRSWHGWDPARFAYGNYIDAMAMLRRSIVLEVGGYTTDARLYGWEDFELWCRLTARGLHGVHVPNILGRYRRGHTSMLAVTDLDPGPAWEALIERYPQLMMRPLQPDGQVLAASGVVGLSTSLRHGSLSLSP